MSFGPVIACGSSISAGTGILALIWLLPAVLLALRNCKPVGSPTRRGLGLWLGASAGLSCFLSAIGLDVLAEWAVMAPLLIGLTAGAAIGGVMLYRLAWRR